MSGKHRIYKFPFCFYKYKYARFYGKYFSHIRFRILFEGYSILYRIAASIIVNKTHFLYMKNNSSKISHIYIERKILK